MVENSFTLLDNVYTNCPITESSGVLKTDITDHYSIFTVRDHLEPIKDSKHREVRNLSIKNIFKSKKSLKQVNWNLLYEQGTQAAFSHFYETIIELFNHHFPLQKIEIKYYNKNPWISKELKKEILERERLHLISKKHPTDSNIQAYKDIKNRNLSNQRAAERNYYKNEYELHGNDMHGRWKVLKKVIGKEDNISSTSCNEFIINNKLVTDGHIISNSFNEYFVNVGRLLSEDIDCDTNPLHYVQNNLNSMCLHEITAAEVMTVISMLNNSAAGHDGVPAFIMKQCINEYITPLTHLINLSINEGIFPDELKIAKVIPIYKSDNQQSINNYRPISVLPFFSKIFERVIANHVTDFLEESNILNDNQYGFRRNHSTSHAIICLVEKVAKALDQGKIVVGLMIDLKKAFDGICHKTLLKKLYAYGIMGKLFDWFKSYLTNRTQYVQYGNSKSATKTITHGVPQGSILGPLLFILYVNDFSRASDLLFSILFADDTTVLIEGHEYQKLIKTLNEELCKVDKWLQANKLTLNIRKTHYMLFHRVRLKKEQLNIYFRGESIFRVNSTKFLGVIIDDKLKWTAHIQYIKNKLSKSIGILYKCRNYFDKETMRNLYFSFIYPYLTYCVEIWGNACNIHLDPIVKLQKKCIRTITYSSYLEHTQPLFDSLNILCFHKLVIQRISLMMFKNEVGLVPKPISQLFTKNNEYHDYNTRHSSSLHLSVGRGEAIYRSFSFHGINIWNYL